MSKKILKTKPETITEAHNYNPLLHLYSGAILDIFSLCKYL